MLRHELTARAAGEAWGTHVSGAEEGLLQQGAREAAVQGQCEGCPRPEEL